LNCAADQYFIPQRRPPEENAMTNERAPSRPAVPEVIVGLVLLALVGIGGAFAVMRLDIDPASRRTQSKQNA
jgi:hypothetical protein